MEPIEKKKNGCKDQLENGVQKLFVNSVSISKNLDKL